MYVVKDLFMRLVLVVKLRQGLRVVAGGFPGGEVEGLYVYVDN
jgi:hypothetical protein